jgi:hypothetical protein
MSKINGVAPSPRRETAASSRGPHVVVGVGVDLVDHGRQVRQKVAHPPRNSGKSSAGSSGGHTVTRVEGRAGRCLYEVIEGGGQVRIDGGIVCDEDQLDLRVVAPPACIAELLCGQSMARTGDYAGTSSDPEGAQGVDGQPDAGGRLRVQPHEHDPTRGRGRFPTWPVSSWA